MKKANRILTILMFLFLYAPSWRNVAILFAAKKAHIK